MVASISKPKRAFTAMQDSMLPTEILQAANYFEAGWVTKSNKNWKTKPWELRRIPNLVDVFSCGPVARTAVSSIRSRMVPEVEVNAQEDWGTLRNCMHWKVQHICGHMAALQRKLLTCSLPPLHLFAVAITTGTKNWCSQWMRIFRGYALWDLGLRFWFQWAFSLHHLLAMCGKPSKSTLALARPLHLKFKGDSHHLLETTSLVVVTNYCSATNGIFPWASQIWNNLHKGFGEAGAVSLLHFLSKYGHMTNPL